MPLPAQHRLDLKHLLKWLPVYLAVTLVLYVLAAGPLYFQIYGSFHGPGGGGFLQRLYLPLVVLCETSPAAADAMDWYVRLWV